ncbi:hypothetical protein [uncultured Dysosmobacter sp.]|uniref:hypothetical protein n=1 Tax=uncultured Dysosmobacter sp. TaxID=2591384 RepID=UPI00260B70D5|nr:hypothetical protein [uncultured Dysosmobacter sp.]
MQIIKSEYMLCPCCVEEHVVYTVIAQQFNIFQGVPVEYQAECQYCENADEYYAEGEQITSNFTAMKKVYQKKVQEAQSCQ